MIIANFFALQKCLQIPKGQFVARFVLSIISMLLLYGVVGQMTVYIIWIVVKLLAAGSKVTFFVPISLEIAVVRGHQGIAADVEFSVLVEQRVDVLLNEGALAESAKLSHCLQDVVSALLHADSCSSVCVLAWLHDPNSLFLAQILRQFTLIFVNMVCLGNDFMLADLLSFAVLLDILEQTLLV